MSSVAIAILNWNGVTYLEKFLSNVIQNSVNENTKVYIIDNASTDTSIIYLEQNYPTVSIIQLDKNYGFAEGYNRGLAQINADIFVLLNSDVEVTPNWIEPIVTAMELDNNVAVCMPKIKSYLNKEYFEYAGAAGGFIDKYGYPFCNGRLFDKIEKDKGQYEKTREIFWASGAAMFIKSKVYNELNGLDNDFFAHMEEIDLCWRVKNRGYAILYIPLSTVFHVGGGTLPKANPFKTYLNFRNNLFLLHKNLPTNTKNKIIFTRKILDGIAFIKFLISLDFKNCNAILKAHIDYYKSIKKLDVSRNKLQNKITKQTHKEIYNKSIVLDYFVKRKQKITL